MAKKRKPKHTTKELVGKLDAEIKGIRSSDEFKERLAILGRFPHYRGWTNKMLIAMFKPDATILAAHGQWFNMGYIVNRGESGVPLFRPQKYRQEDEETGEVIKQGTYFRIFYSFDISQVRKMTPEQIERFRNDGKSIAKDAPLDPYKHKEIFAFRTKETDDDGWLPVIVDLMKADGIDVSWADNLGNGVMGVSQGGAVVLLENESALTQFRVGIHEWAHEKLHKTWERVNLTRPQKEFEAEGVGYVVCNYLGLPQASANYLAGYGNYELKPAIERIGKGADAIIGAINENPLV